MRLKAFALAGACAAAGVAGLAGCGDTLQTKPIPHNILESLIVSPFPVYWAGDSFQKLQVTDATHDPSGAYSVQYGVCLEGGQGTCVTPLRIITSADNSFLPGSGGRVTTRVRGVPAVIGRGGRTIAIATGPVVVSIFASDATLAAAAARAVVPINAPGSPRQPLPARLPDTGYAARPLHSQMPPYLGPLD